MIKSKRSCVLGLLLCAAGSGACSKDTTNPAPDAGSTVVDVEFPHAPGSPGVPLLPKLKNVVAVVDDDRAAVTFEPVEGARDYRVYPLPAAGDVQVSSTGAVAIKNALYRCAGDRFAPRAVKDGDPGQANGWTTTWVNRAVEGVSRTEADATLGQVFAEPGAGRLPVYALGAPESDADNNCGGETWAASRSKRYTVSDTERAQLLGQGYRDDGVVFYAPSAGDVPVKTGVSSGIRLYFSSAAEVAARKPLGPETAFSVLSAAGADTVALKRVHYHGGCGGTHDELVTAGGYARALTQANQPFFSVQWSGLTAETVLVVEALDKGCPFQGHASARAVPATNLADRFFTLAELVASVPDGEVYLNGQHQAGAPKAVARTFIKVQPKPRPAMEWSAGFGPGETWTFTETGRQNHGSQDLQLTGNGVDVQFYDLEPDVYGLGTVGGELWVTYADWGADVPGKFRLTPKQTATLAADSYLHATMTTELWSTGRRYAQLIVSDVALPIQDNLAKGTSLIVQTRGPWPFEVELQSCAHRSWDVNDQCPRYRIGHKPFVGAPWAPAPFVSELVGPSQLVRVDLYASTSRAYLLVDGRPYGCARLVAGPAAGPLHVTFGDVLYHSGVDEPVVSKPTSYQFLFDHQLTETRRQFDNLGFESGVAAPAWNESLVPCATATDP